MSENRIETGLCSCPSCGPPTEVDNTDPCGCVLCGDTSRCDANGQPGQCCSEDCCDPVEGACANTVGIWGPILYTVAGIGLGWGLYLTPTVFAEDYNNFVIQTNGNSDFVVINRAATTTLLSIGALALTPNAIIACARA